MKILLIGGGVLMASVALRHLLDLAAHIRGSSIWCPRRYPEQEAS